MKALTVSQPWASKIASGEKWVENRTWYTPYRGPLAIHAGKGGQYLTKKELERYPTGCVLAVAEMVACVKLDAIGAHAREIVDAGLTVEQVKQHEYSEGPYCWVLRNIQALTAPVPCSGAQGLWEWRDCDGASTEVAIPQSAASGRLFS